MQLRLLFILFFYSHAVVSMLSTYHRMDIRNRQINKLQTSNFIVACIKSMHSYTVAKILVVYLLFCKLYGIFVCPALLVLLYYCRLYKINAFLYDRQNPDCIFVVL